jgi:ribosomal protein L16 Arg81 hydroxylase
MPDSFFDKLGTVSPLHHDPYHNLLCQVVGKKYIKLFSPKFSKNVYPHEELMLYNTSRVETNFRVIWVTEKVDVENADLEAFPLFAEAEYVDCVLGEGEMLYIPPKVSKERRELISKWWHYVRSLSVSFSVSFWWK